MRETYFALAIDVGSSRVTAATARVNRDAPETPTLFSLGASEHSASSAAFADDDGELFFGDAAEHLGIERPELLAREFMQSVGDDVPIMIGDRAVLAEDVCARLCAWVVTAVTDAAGERPEAIAVTHPVSWSGHRQDRLRAALQRVGIEAPILCTEPEAAARHHEDSHPIESGRMLAVYDLGGTRFDALVLRRRATARYQLAGEQVRIDDLGGANFDDAVLRQVLTSTPADAELSHAALAQLRRDVVKAKELLSSAGDATVDLPAETPNVRITRSEFEAMIDADLERTVDALELAVESAGISSDRLEAVVLTGGSSRIPLVAQRLSERFDLPIIADADPLATTALGAAEIAVDQLRAEASGSASAVLDTTSAAALIRTPKNEPASVAEPDPEPVAQPTRALAFLRPLLGKPRSASPFLLGAAAVLIAVTIVFSNTTAAGSRWPDYVQGVAENILHLNRPTGLVGPDSPVPDGSTPQSDRTHGTTPIGNTDRIAMPDGQQTPGTETARPESTPTTPETSPTSDPTAPSKSNDATPRTGTPASPGPDDSGTTTAPTDSTPPDSTPPADPPAPEPPAENPPADDPPADTTPVAETSSGTAPADAPEPTPGPTADPA